MTKLMNKENKMTKLLILALLSLLTVACEATDEQTAITERYSCETLAYIGNWYSDSRGHFLIYPDCHIADDYCGRDFNFTLPDIETGLTTFIIDKDSPKSSNVCPGQQDLICSLEMDKNHLTIDCGSIYVFEYTKHGDGLR